MADFRKLRVWVAAQDLAVCAHHVSGRLRGARSATLCDQLVRAAMSVPTNIVEGSAHQSPREFARFLQYALASATEVEGHVQLARDVGMMSERDYDGLITRVVDVRKMLHGLLKKVGKVETHARKGKSAKTENEDREVG
ncbi:MAG: four helix bundle protein [Gemmatimonadaceae bacterium]